MVKAIRFGLRMEGARLHKDMGIRSNWKRSGK